jgi:hypothetical protein
MNNRYNFQSKVYLKNEHATELHPFRTIHPLISA